MGLDAIDIVLQIEKAFCINLPEKRLEQAQTVGQLHELILEVMDTPSMVSEEQVCRRCNYNLWGLRGPRCPECGTPFIFRGQVSPEAAWDMLVEILGYELGITHEAIRPDLRFLEDLNF